MKKLSIFRTDEGIVVERENQFGTKFKSVYETKDGLIECLGVYKESDTLADYTLHVSDEFWGLVINFVNSDHGQSELKTKCEKCPNIKYNVLLNRVVVHDNNTDIREMLSICDECLDSLSQQKNIKWWSNH